jgi:cytochrome c5
MKRTFMLTLVLVIMIGFASAQEKQIKQITLPTVPTELAQGEGKDKVATLCNICHSVDYITMQPKGSKTQWTAEVTKMRKVFGAPMSDADSDVIITYLTEKYGTGH